MRQPVTRDGGTALHVVYKKVLVAEYCGIQDPANSDGVLMGGPSKRIRVLNTFADGYSSISLDHPQGVRARQIPTQARCCKVLVTGNTHTPYIHCA